MYEGGGKLHSFLTLALDGEAIGYLNALVATPPAKQCLVLTGWAPEPAWTTQNVRFSQHCCWRFKSSEIWHCADRRTGVNFSNCSAFIFRTVSGRCIPLTEKHSSISNQKTWIYSLNTLSMRKVYCIYQKLNQYFFGVQLAG